MTRIDFDYVGSGAFDLPLSRRRSALFALEWNEATRRWTGQFQTVFRPLGVFILGAPTAARLIHLGRQQSVQGDCFVAGSAPLDPRVFAELERLPLQHPARPHFETFAPAERIEAILVDASGMSLGPPVSVTLWGTAVS